MFWTTTRATTIISAAQNHLKPSSSSQRNDRRSLVVTNVTKVIAKKRDLFFPILFSFVYKDIFFLTSFTSIEKRGSAPLYYSYTLTLKHSALFSSRLLTFFACSPHILLILDEYNIR